MTDEQFDKLIEAINSVAVAIQTLARTIQMKQFYYKKPGTL